MATAVKPFELPEMPSVGSDDDEESFVVLATNFPDSCEIGTSQENLFPIEGESTIEAMQSINREFSLSSVSKMSEISEAAALIEAANVPILASPDSSYGDVQKHVEQLIKENEELKNIIAQTNDSMKYQMEQVRKWTQEVNNTVESHKMKIHDAKMVVDRYKEENEKLKMDVEKYKNIKELQDEEIINLKQRPINGQENLKNFVVDNAPEKMSDSHLENTKQKIDELEAKVAQVEKEKKDTEQKMIDTIKIAMQRECDNVDMEGQIAELKKCNDKLRAENDDLQKQLAQAQKLQEAIDSKEEEIKIKLQQDLSASAAVERALKEEIERLKSQIEEFHNRQPLNHEEVQHLRQQLMSSQMTITQLELSVSNKEKALIETQNMLQQCGTKDDMFALKEQLVLYKSDFEAEKEARKALKREKEQIDEDLKNVHRRNQQLQEEIELMRERGFVLCSPPQHSNANESAASVQMDYECPKCRFKFKDYQVLENHVFRCLEVDDCIP